MTIKEGTDKVSSPGESIRKACQGDNIIYKTPLNQLTFLCFFLPTSSLWILRESFKAYSR